MPRTRLILLAALFAMLLTTSCDRAGEKRRPSRNTSRKSSKPAPPTKPPSAPLPPHGPRPPPRKTSTRPSPSTPMTPCNSPNKAPAAKGKENIRKNWAPLLAAARPRPELANHDSVEVARSGDMAYETGAYDFVTTDKKGKSSDEKGKYVVVWKKQNDGSWKVVVDMDNPDQ